MFFGGDPFEHFAGMHGGGGGGGRRGGGPSRDVDTTKLYETLGVSSCADRYCTCTLVVTHLLVVSLLLGLPQRVVVVSK